MPDAVSVPLLIVIGILLGGVINVLADDLPHDRRPRLPRYPDDTPRPLPAWLGLSAFLLGKRTSPNGAKLSWRHPLTEVFTALGLVVTLLATNDDVLRTDLQLFFWLCYVVAFVLITVIDLEHRLILYVTVIPTAVLAIIDSLTTPAIDPQPGLGDALIGGAVGFGVFFLLYLGGYVFTYISSRVRDQEITEVAFGFGDVLLAGVCGLILGWRLLFFAIFITVFLGALGAVVYMAWRNLSRNRYTMFSPIPYGPYIVIGTLIMMLFPMEFRMLIWGF